MAPPVAVEWLSHPSRGVDADQAGEALLHPVPPQICGRGEGRGAGQGRGLRELGPELRRQEQLLE